jgi:hypothetical protein
LDPAAGLALFRETAGPAAALVEGGDATLGRLAAAADHLPLSITVMGGSLRAAVQEAGRGRGPAARPAKAGTRSGTGGGR